MGCLGKSSRYSYHLTWGGEGASHGDIWVIFFQDEETAVAHCEARVCLAFWENWGRSNRREVRESEFIGNHGCVVLPIFLKIGNYPSLLNLFPFFLPSLTLVSHQVLLILTLFSSDLYHWSPNWSIASCTPHIQHPFKSYFSNNVCIAGPALGIVDTQAIKLALRKFTVSGDKINRQLVTWQWSKCFEKGSTSRLSTTW